MGLLRAINYREEATETAALPFPHAVEAHSPLAERASPGGADFAAGHADVADRSSVAPAPRGERHSHCSHGASAESPDSSESRPSAHAHRAAENGQIRSAPARMTACERSDKDTCANLTSNSQARSAAHAYHEKTCIDTQKSKVHCYTRCAATRPRHKGRSPMQAHPTTAPAAVFGLLLLAFAAGPVPAQTTPD